MIILFGNYPGSKCSGKRIHGTYAGAYAQSLCVYYYTQDVAVGYFHPVRYIRIA
jgi:hypothetical protein